MSGHMISQRELRNDSGKIMRGLEEGETYIITRNGTPIVELRPNPRRGTRDAVLAAFAGAPPMDYKVFRAELDHNFDQSVPERG